MTPELLAHLTPSEREAWEMCQKATPGDVGWYVGCPDEDDILIPVYFDGEHSVELIADFKRQEDAEFAALARTALPEALQSLAELRGNLAEAQKAGMSKKSTEELLAEQWWREDGRFIDPDTSDVPWDAKRAELAQIAYIAGFKRTHPENSLWAAKLDENTRHRAELANEHLKRLLAEQARQDETEAVEAYRSKLATVERERDALLRQVSDLADDVIEAAREKIATPQPPAPVAENATTPRCQKCGDTGVVGFGSFEAHCYCEDAPRHSFKCGDPDYICPGCVAPAEAAPEKCERCLDTGYVCLGGKVPCSACGTGRAQ